MVDFFSHALPDDCWFSAINPIPSKTPAVAGRSKAMGMKAGVPDFVLCWDGRFYGVELKTTKGRPSKAQVATFNQIHDAGGYVHVAKSVESVADFLRGIGVPLKARMC